MWSGQTFAEALRLSVALLSVGLCEFSLLATLLVSPTARLHTPCGTAMFLRSGRLFDHRCRYQRDFGYGVSSTAEADFE